MKLSFEYLDGLIEDVESNYVLATKNYHTCMRTIGGSARSLREEKGVSLRELARLMGLTPAYLSDMERGNRMFNRAMLSRYRDALDKHRPK